MAILEIKIQNEIIDLYDEEKVVQSFSLINIEDITNDEKYNRYLNFWICMPEANFKFYIKNSNILYEELGYYGCIQR